MSVQQTNQNLSSLFSFGIKKLKCSLKALMVTIRWSQILVYSTRSVFSKALLVFRGNLILVLAQVAYQQRAGRTGLNNAL